MFSVSDFGFRVSGFRRTCCWYVLNSGEAAALSATASAQIVWLCGPPCERQKGGLDTRPPCTETQGLNHCCLLRCLSDSFCSASAQIVWLCGPPCRDKSVDPNRDRAASAQIVWLCGPPCTETQGLAIYCSYYHSDSAIYCSYYHSDIYCSYYHSDSSCAPPPSAVG